MDETKKQILQNNFLSNYPLFLSHVLKNAFKPEFGIPWWITYIWYLIVVKKEQRVVDVIPRKHAKTTGNTFGLVMYHILNRLKRHIAIISNTGDQAISFLERIRWYLSNDPMIREIYGSLDSEYIGEDYDVIDGGEKSKISKKWNSRIIRTGNGVTVAALGAGKSMRGLIDLDYRPDLIIGDDIEDKKNTNTIDLRRQLGSWWYEVVMELGDESCQYLYNGTIPHHDALIVALMNNPQWHHLVLRCMMSDNEILELKDKIPPKFYNLFLKQMKTVDGTSEFGEFRHILWGNRYSLEYFTNKLLDARQSVVGGRSQEASFWQENFNMPKSEKEKVFTQFPTFEFELRELHYGN